MNKDECLQQWNHLRVTFAKTYDHTLVQSFCKTHDLFSPQNLRQLEYASGRLFSCVKLSRPGQTMDLAIKVLHRNTEADIFMRNLTRHLDKFCKIPGPNLLPPIELLNVDGHPIMVMPFGPQQKSDAAAAWLPLGLTEKLLVDALEKNGLFIDDVLQIRAWRGIPFLIDFSDLRPIKD